MIDPSSRRYQGLQSTSTRTFTTKFSLSLRTRPSLTLLTTLTTLTTTTDHHDPGWLDALWGSDRLDSKALTSICAYPQQILSHIVTATHGAACCQIWHRRRLDYSSRHTPYRSQTTHTPDPGTRTARPRVDRIRFPVTHARNPLPTAH